MEGSNDHARHRSRDFNITPHTGSSSFVPDSLNPDPHAIPTNTPESLKPRRYAMDGGSSVQAIPGLPDEPTIRPYPLVPKFIPLYAVVSDATSSSETHYPRVRYIFSDDDPDILSGALAIQHDVVQFSEDSVPLEKNATGPSSRPVDHALPGTNRVLLLDLAVKENGRGYEISSATSLSADWAITTARLNSLDPRPTDNMQEDDNQPMVLNIEGIGFAPETAISPNAQRAETGRVAAVVGGNGKSALCAGSDITLGRDYAGLIGDFDKRMLLLKSTVQQANKRQPQFSKAEAD